MHILSLDKLIKFSLFFFSVKQLVILQRTQCRHIVSIDCNCAKLMSNYFFGNLYTYHYKSHAISSHVYHYVYKFKG